MNGPFNKNRKFFILIPITLFFGIGAIVKFLWNATLPDMMGLKAINYWQALGIFALSKILFGNFGFGKGRPPFANNSFKERMFQMSDEEKEKFKNEWKHRCK